MATGLWVKTIRNHRIDRQVTVPCGREDPREALLQACHDLDLPEPVWLDKNQREWEEFGMTRFLPDAFFEEVPFPADGDRIYRSGGAEEKEPGFSKFI